MKELDNTCYVLLYINGTDVRVVAVDKTLEQAEKDLKWLNRDMEGKPFTMKKTYYWEK